MQNSGKHLKNVICMKEIDPITLMATALNAIFVFGHQDQEQMRI